MFLRDEFVRGLDRSLIVAVVLKHALHAGDCALDRILRKLLAQGKPAGVDKLVFRGRTRGAFHPDGTEEKHFLGIKDQDQIAFVILLGFNLYLSKASGVIQSLHGKPGFIFVQRLIRSLRQ